MKYRTIFVYSATFIFLFALWYAAIDLNSDYWSYVNKNWQKVRFEPFNTIGRWWTLLTALFGCFMSLMSAILVIGMTWVGLKEAKKEYKNRKQLKLF